MNPGWFARWRRVRPLAELVAVLVGCAALAPWAALALPAGWPRVWAELGTFALPALLLCVWRASRHGRRDSTGRLMPWAAPEGLALLMLVVGLASTTGVVARLDSQRRALAGLRFNHLADQLQQELQGRLERPLQALQGLRGLYAARSDFSRLEFARWVATWDLNATPGVLGLGFVERVPAGRLAAFVERQRRDDAPGFKVDALQDDSDRFIVSYVEPLKANRALSGRDFAREAAARAALEAALRSGQPTLSGQFAVDFGDGQAPGMLLILPVHDAEADLRTEASRFASTAGFLVAPLAMDRVLANTAAVTQDLLDFDLVDTGGAGRPQALGRVDQDRSGLRAGADSQDRHGQLRAERALLIGGRPIALYAWSTPRFDDSLGPSTAYWIGVLGSVLSGLLAAVVWLVSTERERAQQWAARMVEELREASRATDAARRENELLLYTMNQHCIVSMTDPEGRINYCNPAFCDISGHQASELFGQQHNAINSGVHPPAFWDDFWATLRDGRTWQGELCNRDKDGRLYWVKSTIVPFMDETGVIERFVAVSTDVTREHTARQDLMTLNQRFSIALEGSNDGLWDWVDTQGQAMWWSPQLYRMLGLAPGTGESNIAEFDHLRHPDDQAVTQAALAAALAGLHDYDVEYRLRCGDGGYRWFRSRAKIFRDADGEHRRMAGSLQDINELKLAQARLRTRNAQMSAIFAASPDGYLSFDLGRRVGFVSPAMQRLTGLPRETLVGLELPAVLQRLAEMGSFGIDESPDQRLQALRGAGLVLNLRVGQHRTLSLHLHAAEADSEISQLLLVRDITRQVEVEQMKSEFLSTAAHELRTPMASIYGFTEILMMRELPAERRQQFLAKIHRQSQSMMNILNELLDLARIEARRGKDFDLRTERLDDILREAVQDFQPPPDREPPRLTLDTTDPWVRVDRAKLLQVLRNLLSNAYKYSPDGGEVQLRLTRAALAAWLRLDVVDHGIGMTDEQLQHVTERFYRADTSGAIAGTGLGMSIVKEIVELHGGRLELSSRQGSGSCVSVLLPCIEAPAVTAPADAGANA